jgi:hypothetical protein
MIAAALSVATPAIPSVEAAIDGCEAIGPTQCPLREPHPDNRDLEIENPGAESAASRLAPPATYPQTTGGTITVTSNTGRATTV